MTRPDILKGPWKLNGANVTAKADWQLLVASPPYREAPKPTPDALAVTEGEAMQLAVAIHALPDLLAALEMLLFTSESQLDQSSTHDGLRNCKVLADTRQALTKAGYEFDFAAKK